jgi:sterol desaturase/sphingolipid hydroxylase (fatty acid hydroxylase superfamily)
MLEHPVHRRCFVVLGALALGLIVGAIMRGVGIGAAFGLWLLGLLGWTFVEYLLHRFAFHLPRSHPLALLGARQHLDHHDAPSRLPISKPLQLTLPAIAIGVGTIAALGGAPGLAVSGGLVSGYFGYELLHVAAHVLVQDHPLRSVQRSHLEHHRDPASRFGITSPLWDAVLGTLGKRIDRT